MSVLNDIMKALDEYPLMWNKDNLTIVVPKKRVKAMLKELEELAGVNRDIQEMSMEGLKLNGIRVISSPDVNEIEVL